MINYIGQSAWNLATWPVNYIYKKPQSKQLQKSNLQLNAQTQVSNGQNLVRTPQSGYHYEGLNRRFFEGWYFRVQISNNDSIALIYSIEDPVYKSKNSGTAVQIMGPQDGYTIQHSPETDIFWANKRELELGATFKRNEKGQDSQLLKQIVDSQEFFEKVQYGYQASYTSHQGRIRSDKGKSTGHVPTSQISECEWDFKTEPILGWGGDQNQQQHSTAGWLSNIPLFEPQWQVLLARGKSTGKLKWGDQVYEFKDAPTYSEKNWGGGFPLKWFWVQCNTFNEDSNLALTACGAMRGFLNFPVQEIVGLIGLTYKGKLIQISPYQGEGVEWEVTPWGHWKMQGQNDEFKISLECTCDQNVGAVLRAPTVNDGLAPACKDTFYGKIKLILQEKDPKSKDKIINKIEYTSSTCACEVGGGPWWYTWKAKSKYESNFTRQFINPPIDFDSYISRLPKNLQPFGF